MHHRIRSTLLMTLAMTLVMAMPLAAAPGGGNGGGGGGSTTLPNSIASLGDSITQAANLDGGNIGASHPEHSWSTGYDSGDIVNSHYERLLANNRKIKGQTFNKAVSGAKMDDAPAQADNVVATGAQYVTFLMGGNDVCTSSNTNMTPLSSFETNFRLAMDKLTTGLPDAKIYVLSVPDVYQLWRLFDGEWYPEWVWSTFDICQSMLDNSRTEADRQAVRAHNMAFNDILAAVCAEYTQCLWDNYGVFNYQFTRADVSGVDYFHPSMTGQKNLAQQSWAGGYWPTL